MLLAVVIELYISLTSVGTVPTKISVLTIPTSYISLAYSFWDISIKKSRHMFEDPDLNRV